MNELQQLSQLHPAAQVAVVIGLTAVVITFIICIWKD